MRIAVVGAGGTGGYFGGLLARAGHEVIFIARGAHLAAICEKGLQVRSVHGDFRIAPAKATDEVESVGQVDYAIVAVKHYHLREAALRVKPLVGEQTTVVPLLNGVDAHEVLAEAVGPDRVVGGLCSLVAYIEAPGVIRQESRLQRVVIGELDQTATDRVARLVAAWKAAGADAVQAEDILAALWTKFIFIASFGGIGALVRLPAGDWRGAPQTRALFIEALREAEGVGRALGVRLAADVVAGAVAMTDGFEPTTTSSMQRDVAAGREFELDAFSGKIVQLGETLGIPTPVHRSIDALLRPALIAATCRAGR